MYVLGMCVWSRFCDTFLCAISSLEIISFRKRGVLNFKCIFSFISVSLFVCVLMSILQGAMGWSVICDCGISCSYFFNKGQHP